MLIGVRSLRVWARSIHGTTLNKAVRPFLLTDIGEGTAEVDVLEWYVSVGEKVEQFTPLCKVQSDKATTDISSPFEGIITELCYAENGIAKVGDPLLHIDVIGEDADTNGTAKKEEPAPAAASTGLVSDTPRSAIEISKTGKVLTTPAVRHIAKTNGIDLLQVTGTGKAGRILKSDVLGFMESGKDSLPESVTPPAAMPITFPTTESREIPIRGVQRLMYQSMTASLQIPHFVYCDEVEMDELKALRAQVKQMLQHDGADEQLSISFMPFLIKATSLALREFPLLNSSILDETRLLQHGDHNIGVAMDTPSGLVVPSVKQVQERSILEIAQELTRLQQIAPTGAFAAEDLKHTTFSVSNIGSIGGTYASPIICPPQVSIGAFGKIQTLPRFDDNGQVKAVNTMQMSWAADHRIIDGATMARFSNKMKDLVERPALMMASMR